MTQYLHPIELPPLASDPASLIEAEVWYAGGKLKTHNGTAVRIMLSEELAASTANGEGASLVGMEDAGTHFTATDVEGGLQEIMTNIKADTIGLGADIVGLYDPGAYFVATNVGAGLQELKADIAGLAGATSWKDPVQLTEQDSALVTPSANMRVLVQDPAQLGTGGSFTAAGDFATQEGKIAIRDAGNSAWSFVSPAEGWKLYAEDQNVWYFFSDSSVWNSEGSVTDHENLLGLLGGAAGDHYHFTGVEHTFVQALPLTTAGNGGTLVGLDSTTNSGAVYSNVGTAIEGLFDGQAGKMDGYKSSAAEALVAYTPKAIVHGLGTRNLIVNGQLDNGGNPDKNVRFRWIATDNNTVTILSAVNASVHFTVAGF